MKYILSIFLSILIAFSSLSLENQAKKTVVEMEVKLDSLFQLLRKKGNSNQDYLTINKAFKLQLKKVLKLDEAFIHDFKFLKKSMSTITSPDGAFRLFNWNIEMESGVNNFHCFILTKKGKIIELRDNYRFIENPEFKSLTQRNWYGALYYKIIPMKKGKYTLLGWNGKDEITTQKVIETMSISRRSAKFGLDIFEYPGERINKKRVIVEYANDAFVAMKFYNNKDSKQIVFSHVGPSTPQVEGFYQYYYPDGTDSFELTNKGNWLFKLDSKYLNPKSKVDSQWKLPKENAPN